LILPWARLVAVFGEMINAHKVLARKFWKTKVGFRAERLSRLLDGLGWCPMAGSGGEGC
jgi:hypothetical protein